MTLKVAVQMDPIESITIRGDSTFALMLEAQARGHRLFYYLPDSLGMTRDAVTGFCHEVTALREEQGNHFSLGDGARTDLSTMDVVLLRQDPPFDMHYISTTHILERIHPKTLVVNDPVNVRNMPEKVFVTEFPDLMPPTLITRDGRAIKEFRAEHKDIIVKPLYGNGGAAVFRLTESDTNLASLLELFQQSFREPYVIQKYLPAVRKGDKRVILVDGKAVGAINRVPAADETRSNMHVGGRAEACEMTKRDHEICEAIGPALKERGMIFVGIDVIGDYLTEINVTSPTGIRELKRFGGADTAALVWDAIEAKR
ncbi:MAG: glutathione synthase [Rhodobiaceae bacterium]|nr:glutathione synthase [Rhodobiaceae bacterium]